MHEGWRPLPGTRDHQTLYRFVGPKGELRADAEKLTKRNGKNGIGGKV
jgi:hypothetical protein